MYEPVSSLAPQSMQHMPNMMGQQPQYNEQHIPQQQNRAEAPQAYAQQVPHMTPAAKPSPPGSNNVKVPQTPEKPSTWADISEYEQLGDWIYIALGVIVVEVILLFLVRYYPNIFGKGINLWYNRFKLSAVIADVLIIMLGFGITRYIYTEFIYPTYDWNPLYFTVTATLVQIAHDILFYFGIIRQVPRNHNAMMDTMKDYGEISGVRAIAGDSALVIGSSVVSMLLKGAPPHITAFIGLAAAYTIPYILETRNEYSTIS